MLTLLSSLKCQPLSLLNRSHELVVRTALLLGGLYHGYRQLRNRKVNEALVQGVETAREILTTTPQGQAVDAQFVKWLMEHQKEAGVFSTVSTLVDTFTDNPAAKLTAQEIAERVKASATLAKGGA